MEVQGLSVMKGAGVQRVERLENEISCLSGRFFTAELPGYLLHKLMRRVYYRLQVKRPAESETYVAIVVGVPTKSV